MAKPPNPAPAGITTDSDVVEGDQEARARLLEEPTLGWFVGSIGFTQRDTC